MDSLRLAALGLKAATRLGLDAVSPASLPYRAEDVRDPKVLSRLLNEGSLGLTDGPVEITRVTQQGIPSVSSNCENLVLSIEQGREAGLPSSIFVKIPMASWATRWFFSVIHSWKLESEFFRHVAADLPLLTPRTYATDWRGSRFYLVQENLNEDPGVELFTNPDMLAGPSLERVRQCLDTFARLHAIHFGLGAAEREAILPLTWHPFLSPTLGPVSRTLNRMGLAPCLKRYPGALPPEIEAAYRLSLEHWSRLRAHWFEGPLSLLHGDSHLGNFYVRGAEMGMLDWQAVHWGKGIRDVEYFLVDSLPAEVLAAHERELVDYYCARRAVHGEPIDPEQTWQDYRGFTFHTLMTIVVSIGFGALNEDQDRLMREILSRTVAAAQRVDYPGWLRGLLA